MIGLKIKVLRTKKGFRQNDFCEMINITQSHFSQIENGHLDPSLKLLRVIADKLDVELKELI